MNRSLLIIILSIVTLPDLVAQPTVGLEHYHFWYRDGDVTMPVLKYRSPAGLYADIRYNYDDVNTFSFNAGKEFSREGVVSYSFLPMIGITVGSNTAVTTRILQEYSWKSFTFSGESQYLFASARSNGYFFNWSELLFEPDIPLFGGIVMQGTWGKDDKLIEAGFVGGFSIGKISFPLYLFSPFCSRRYFAAGVAYEHTFKKRKNIISNPIP